MPSSRPDLQAIIQTLSRQRVLQGDFDRALESIVIQATTIGEQWPTGALADLASEMKARAIELRRMKDSVPRFVVEDLIEESINRLREHAGM